MESVEPKALSGPQTTTIAGIMLRSPDPVRLAAWYNSVLGVTFDEMVNEGCFGALKTVQFGILPGPLTGSPPSSRLALTYHVPDFDHVTQTLARIGTLAAAQSLPTGERMVFLRDPDGNELAIAEQS